jgi:alanine racemase
VGLQKTFAEVSLKALSNNLSVVRKKTGQKGIIAVVKANAYGHGIAETSDHIIKTGVSYLGVAYTHEGVGLRRSGIQSPILIFFDRSTADACIKYKLTPVVHDVAFAKELSKEAYKRNTVKSVHVKVDTGMGRVGLDLKKAEKEIADIINLKNIAVEGLMSHFSDADLQDKDFANLQLGRFRSVIRNLKKKKITFRHIHMANSAAILTMPDTHFDLVRPGIMLYGYACCEREKIKPVLSLKSGIILLKKVPAGAPIGYGRTFITKRKSTIATVPVGYADGYSRKLSNKGEVLISGKRAPVAGRVCMDTIMVDVTGIPDVSYRSEVVLIGSQGKERITADELAEKIGTIPYDILTSIGERVRRIYA